MMLLLAVQALYVGNGACLTCHAEIWRSYAATPMARSSGRIAGDVVPGSFRHAASGLDYRIEANGVVQVSKGPAHSERTLHYFIGSGAAGRSYLYSRDGFLFQAPVTWYSQKAMWDVSPGYEADRTSRWNRAIDASCLSCHASQLRVAAGFENRYGDPPFAQNGVGCERCHGPGSLHIQGKGGMVNPAKLDPARRDAVCMQCHLSGEARIARAGRRFADYRPGELLSDYAAYFVGEDPSGLKATSHVEKLSASRCKRVSGDRLWCGTCHDPHRLPSGSGRIAWYRSKCLDCHEQQECRRGEDCVSCHMPKGRVTDGGHGVLTDHSIPRRAGTAAENAGSWRLKSFPGTGAGDRELGLAYAEVAQKTGDAHQMREAMRLLSGVAPDAEVLMHLAYLSQRSGNTARATRLYQDLLERNRDSVAALVNLGGLYGASGRLDEAIPLWREALKRNPCQSEAGTNLIRAFQARGNSSAAREVRESQAFCVLE